MTDYLVTASNETLRQLRGATALEITTITQERQQVERELANFVDFVAKGNVSSPRLHEEIRVREQQLNELDERLKRLHAGTVPTPLQIDRTWMEARMLGLNELLAQDPAGARREIQKHVEDLRIAPALEVEARVVRLTGRAKLDDLFGGEEAVRRQLVAGARFGLWERLLGFDSTLTY